MWSGHELTGLRLCTLGLGDVMHTWCVGCSCAAVNQGSDTSVYLKMLVAIEILVVAMAMVAACVELSRGTVIEISCCLWLVLWWKCEL